MVCVVTKPDTVRGRGHKIDSPCVAKIARQFDIPVLQPHRLRDITEDLTGFKAQAGVLVSYGKIVPQSIIDIFPSGIINIHPSLLPKYRGPSPIESAILNDDRETGITLMSLEKEMDAGPIYLQKTITLFGDETKPELYDRFSKIGAEMLSKNLSSILDGKLPSKPQEDSLVTYCSLIKRERDGFIDPRSMTAKECHSRVRAFLGWPKTRMGFLSENLIITKTRILADFEGEKWPDVVHCKDDTYLQIVELVAPSGKQMKTADYLRGMRP